MKIQRWAIIFLFFTGLCLSINGCKKPYQKSKNSICLPGHVFIIYLGEVNKPISPLLIHTEIEDSVKAKYYDKDRDRFIIYGYFMRKYDWDDYLKVEFFDSAQYFLIKEYILSHNTQRDVVKTSNENNSLKIYLLDQCDSISYIVDKENLDYFSHLIDILKNVNNNELLKQLSIYKFIQERDMNFVTCSKK